MTLRHFFSKTFEAVIYSIRRAVYKGNNMSNEETKNRFQQQGRVKVVKGSILTPENAGLRFVLNVNNMAGKAESPLYPLFDKKWKKVKEEAKGWYNTRTGAYKLGAVNTTAVQSDTWVIHMLCQDEEFKTDVKSLTACLDQICKSAKYERASVHVSTLLTDHIPELQELLTKHLVEQGVSVSYYEEPAT
jgi:hypothetical protein